MSEFHGHRHIGESLDLFHFPVSSPGMASWHPNGLHVYQLLEGLLRKMQQERSYIEVRSPLVCDNSMWERSGHADKYLEDMFVLEVDDKQSALKPMSCPGHADYFASRPRSYRELPLRVAEFGHVHRNELSGAVNGLLRARSFVQDDAHLFCRENQVEAEIISVLAMADKVYSLFGLVAKAELSLRPDNRLGDDALWDRAEHSLRQALIKANWEFEERPNEGAFYGPKIDLHVEDNLGRMWQLGSCQLDYQLPQRFDLQFVNENGAFEQPVIVHRAILGSIERFIGIILEHFNGRLPLWLSPQAIRILPVGEAQNDYAHEIKRLLVEGVKSEVVADGPLSGRIRDAADSRVSCVIVVGGREAENGCVNIRQSDGHQHQVPLANFISAVSMAYKLKMLDWQEAL